MTTPTGAGSYQIIPCGAHKLDHAAPARDLYTSSTFRMALKAAEVEAAASGGIVLILSALHGLVTTDTVLEPYDLRMDQAGSVTADTLAAQAAALGMDWMSDVYGFLPAAYFTRLDEALRRDEIYMTNVYEAAPGIGHHRGVLANVARPLPSELPTHRK